MLFAIFGRYLISFFYTYHKIIKKFIISDGTIFVANNFVK